MMVLLGAITDTAHVSTSPPDEISFGWIKSSVALPVALEMAFPMALALRSSVLPTFNTDGLMQDCNNLFKTQKAMCRLTRLLAVIATQ